MIRGENMKMIYSVGSKEIDMHFEVLELGWVVCSGLTPSPDPNVLFMVGTNDLF